MKNSTQVIIIGAGASGLMAARELCTAGMQVLILEGRNRIGGRIATLHESGFGLPVETGAEFIHGELELTFGLLKKYNIERIPVGGEMMRISHDEAEKEKSPVEDVHGYLAKTLHGLSADMTIEDFVAAYLSAPQYAQLAAEVRGFVQGYDTADTRIASTFAFREEWLDEEWKQFRVKDGYSKITEALWRDCEQQGAKLHLDEIVKTIRWSRGKAEITTASGNHYEANRVIVTVPPGVLREKNGTASIEFIPPLPQIEDVIKKIGYGPVIKAVFQFSEPFWEQKEIEKRLGKKLKNLGFLFGLATFPTWWTQAPAETPMLSGWLGGPSAEQWESFGEDALFIEAIHSLSVIFGEEKEKIASYVTAWKITDWRKDVFSRGAYSYRTVNDEAVLDILRMPVEDTLYFGGEATSTERGTGTVEAALDAGISIAARALA